MAEFQQKPETGTLFPNDYKKADNQPDWRGTFLDDNGKEWALAGWNKTGKSGKTFISLKRSEPYKKDAQEQKPKSEPVRDCPQPEPEDENPDDLPF